MGMYRYDGSDEESWSEDRDAMSVSSLSTVLDPEVADGVGAGIPLLPVLCRSVGGGAV